MCKIEANIGVIRLYFCPFNVKLWSFLMKFFPQALFENCIQFCVKQLARPVPEIWTPGSTEAQMCKIEANIGVIRLYFCPFYLKLWSFLMKFFPQALFENCIQFCVNQLARPVPELGPLVVQGPKCAK